MEAINQRVFSGLRGGVGGKRRPERIPFLFNPQTGRSPSLLLSPLLERLEIWSNPRFSFFGVGDDPAVEREESVRR